MKKTPPIKNDKIDKLAQNFEKIMSKADEIATRPRRKLLEKRAAEKASPYASFNDRSLAAIIDLSIIFTLLMPIFLQISQAIYGGVSNPLLGDVSHLSASELFDLFISSNYSYSLMLDYAAHFTIFAVIFLGCWRKFSATPGKWVMRMRIVDAATFAKPTMRQFVIRYCAYLLSALPLTMGFMWIMWDSKHQGWHDMLAKTVVVKVKHWQFNDYVATKPEASKD